MNTRYTRAERAYDRGYSSCMVGDPIDANPEGISSLSSMELWEEWRKGWLAGNRAWPCWLRENGYPESITCAEWHTGMRR